MRNPTEGLHEAFRRAEVVVDIVPQSVVLRVAVKTVAPVPEGEVFLALLVGEHLHAIVGYHGVLLDVPRGEDPIPFLLRRLLDLHLKATTRGATRRLQASLQDL